MKLRMTLIGIGVGIALALGLDGAKALDVSRYRLPSEAQVRQVFELAREPEPTKAEVVAFLEIKKNATDADVEALAKRLAEEMSRNIGEPRNRISPEEETKMNVETLEGSLQGAIYFKDRERKWGHLYRLDQRTSFDGFSGIKGVNGYERSVVNTGDESQSEFDNHYYYYGARAAGMDNRKGSMTAEAGYFDAGRIHQGLRILLVKGLAKKGTIGLGRTTKIAPSKARKVSQGRLDSFEIRFREGELRGKAVHEFVFFDKASPSRSYWRLFLNATDYDRIYREAAYVEGVPYFIREKWKYDSHDFPRRLVVKEELTSASPTVKRIFITAVDFSPNFGKEIFEFNPPKEFSITDHRDGKNKLVRTEMVNGKRLDRSAVVNVKNDQARRNRNPTKLLVQWTFVLLVLSIVPIVYSRIGRRREG